MTSARSEACPQGLLGSGIRGLIRTSTAHGHVFLLQLNTNAWRRLTAAWRYCSSSIKALQPLLLSIYQSWKKNHQSVKFHLKSSPVYSSISQAHQIKVKMKNTLKSSRESLQQHSACCCLLSAFICFESRTDQFPRRKNDNSKRGAADSPQASMRRQPEITLENLLFNKYIYVFVL